MKEFDDALFEVSMLNLNRNDNRHSQIDTKATALIAISGFVISLLANNTFSEICLTLNSNIIVKFLFLLSIFLFISTIFISIWVMQPFKYQETMTNDLIQDFSTADPERKYGGVIGSLARTEDQLFKICNKKAERLRYALYAFFTGVFFLGVYSLAFLI